MVWVMIIFNGSNYEQSLLHILEDIVPEAVSDPEIILHLMICCRGIISNSFNYEQSLLHILEDIVPEAVSDAEIILHTMMCCGGIMR